MNPLLRLALVPLLAIAVPAEDGIIRNGGFEDGFNGWTVSGTVSLVKDQSLAGRASARLGPGADSIRQRCAVRGQHVWVEVRIHGDGPGAGQVEAIQEDGAGTPLLTETFEVKKDVHGCWMRMHPRAVAFTLGIANPPGRTWVVDEAKVSEYDLPPYPAPTCDLDGYLAPFWQDGRMRDETVLLVEAGDGPSRARLLYEPTGPVVLRDFAQTTTYTPGIDYTVAGREILVPAGSRIPRVPASTFKAGENQWYKIGGRHAVASYDHRPDADGLPIPVGAGDRLPRTRDRLTRGEPLRVVGFGDSITFGMDVSQHLRIPPFMPTWLELFGEHLRRRHPGGRIEVENAAMSGAKLGWGERTAPALVGSLHPDLVVVAFGMNDFWGTRGDAYQAGIGRIMAGIRTGNPDVEFLLVSPMRFDPAYSANPKHATALTEYAQALERLAGPGVAVLDMTGLSTALYARKSPRDFLTNPLHPNDFLARLYAQGLAALMDPPPVQRPAGP